MTIRLLIISAVILAVSGTPGLLLSRRAPWGQWIATALNIVASAVGLLALILFWSDPALPRAFASSWSLPLGRFSVAIDDLSPVFLIPMFLISAVGSVYGLGYWGQNRHPANGRGLRAWWGLLTAGMIMVVLARDGVLFLMSWEVMALAGFFLVTTEDQKPQVREAGWVYLIAAHVGVLCLFALFVVMRSATGSFDLWPSDVIAMSPAAASAMFILGVIGFGIKAGLMPLHVWLPSAHANAPSHVSAMMSGVLLKTGIYGIVRVAALLPHPPAWWGETLLIAGTLSGVMGIAFAAGQRDLKRLLAYSSIENMGIISIGLGLALMGRTLGHPDWLILGLGGALLHVLNHSLFKPLLFLGAGSVLHAAHTRVIDSMGGLGKSMPRTFVLFLLGAIAIGGLPPLNGFVSELLIYLGLFRAVALDSHGWGWIALAAPALALIGALAVATFVKLVGVVFTGAARTKRTAGAHDPPVLMLGPMVLLGGCCVLIGVLPWTVMRLIDAAVTLPAPATIASYVPLVWVSLSAFLLLALIAVGGLWFTRLQARTRSRSALTWDCGYANPTTRMQYTGSSFSQMLVELLAWVLWPRRRSPRAVGALAAPETFFSEVPDAVLDRGLVPALAAADGALARMRMIQRGTVQRYLLYIMGILVVLLLVG